MKPLLVRKLTPEERRVLEQGLPSSSACTMRRCQMLLSSVQGTAAPQIASQLHCSDQTVRNAIRAFGREGVGCVQEKSHARHDHQSAFDQQGRARLRPMIRLSPRTFGHEGSVWTLAWLAESCWPEKITSRPVNVDNVRYVLGEMGIR